MNDVTFELCKRYYDRFLHYTETAEQHEFAYLVLLNSVIEPAYNDLKNFWDAKHGQIFINGLRSVFAKLGINYSDIETLRRDS